MKRFFKNLFSITIAFSILFGAAPLSGFERVGSSLLKGLSSLNVIAKEGNMNLVEHTQPVSAGDNNSGELACEGQCGENVSWTFDKETGLLTISGTGAMWDYNSWDNFSPFYDILSIVSVKIEFGVTNIGDEEFENCSSLTSIEIPDSVTSIGNYAFCECSSLTNIEIPNSVTTVGDGAFERCASLTGIEIPDSVTSIGDYAFYECTLLTSIEIPDSVTSVGCGAFEGCARLTSVTIGNGVTSIENGTFSGCKSISSITLPDTISSIDNSAFSDCVRLNDVYFSDCQKWNDVNIGTGNENLIEATFHFTTHHYDSGVVVAPTCTQKGYTTYICSVCNNSYVGDYIIAKGHTIGKCLITQQPENGNPGIRTYYCAVCEEYIASEVFYNNSGTPSQYPVLRGVSLSDISIDYLSCATLIPTINADKGANYTVTYSSSDPSVVSVDNSGKVTSQKQFGFNRGSAVITCTATDFNGNTVTDTCTITVKFTPIQWIIKILLFGWIWY